MRHKISELEGALLDAAVAKALGATLDSDGDRLDVREPGGAPTPFHPSSDWRDAGPIIERERICIDFQVGGGGRSWWRAWSRADVWHGVGHKNGPTPLIAAMRALVASKFGDDVELP